MEEEKKELMEEKHEDTELTTVKKEDTELTTDDVEYTELTEENKDEERAKHKKGHGGLIGGGAGFVAGSIATITANPVGNWLLLQGKDHVALDIYEFIENCTKNKDIARVVYNLFQTITNTIIAYPAILPIAGGILTAGLGALVGKKISKGKLKHKNMKKIENAKAK